MRSFLLRYQPSAQSQESQTGRFGNEDKLKVTVCIVSGVVQVNGKRIAIAPIADQIIKSVDFLYHRQSTGIIQCNVRIRDYLVTVDGFDQSAL